MHTVLSLHSVLPKPAAFSIISFLISFPTRRVACLSTDLLVQMLGAAVSAITVHI